MNNVRLRSRPEETRLPVAIFLLVAGIGLLLQGVLSELMLSVSDKPSVWTHGWLNADPLHPVIHIVWGSVMLSVLAMGAIHSAQIRTVLIFGLFYLGLGVLGVIVHFPLGMHIGAGENGFHFTVAVAALLVASWEIREQNVAMDAGFHRR